MCKADLYGTAIEDDMHMALYIKCVINDADTVGGMIFNRWLADCDTKGISIDWEEFLCFTSDSLYLASAGVGMCTMRLMPSALAL